MPTADEGAVRGSDVCLCVCGGGGGAAYLTSLVQDELRDLITPGRSLDPWAAINSAITDLMLLIIVVNY